MKIIFKRKQLEVTLKDEIKQLKTEKFNNDKKKNLGVKEENYIYREVLENDLLESIFKSNDKFISSIETKIKQIAISNQSFLRDLSFNLGKKWRIFYG